MWHQWTMVNLIRFCLLCWSRRWMLVSTSARCLMTFLMKEVTRRLWMWKVRLPANLDFTEPLTGSKEIRKQDFYRPQRSCEGYVFTGVCLSTGRGVVSQHALQVVSQHALQQVSRGVGVVVSQHVLQVVSQHALQQVSRGVGVVVSQHVLQVVSQHALQQVSGGVPAPRGVPAPGGCLLRGGCGGDPPGSRRLLLRTVRILLECILV